MYDFYLNINKNFKASVNLTYDLYNEDKILEYVPTTDLCDVIKQYAKSIINNNEKSTFLAGPYGKGKSYLMLMITFLFSKRDNQELFYKVIDKIKKIDNELYDLLIQLNDSHISLLPVIINNSSYDDVNQNFMLALSNSLIEHGIKELIPITAYTECLSLIDNWETNIESNFDILDLCVKKLNIDLNELKNGLRNYDYSSYKLFEKLFMCVSHGYSFNPLITNDIGLIYSDVSTKLNDYGFNGLFVVFDEFGSFLDSQSGNFATRLNKIQSFAEICNSSSSNHQMHFCCIIHKDIKLYCDRENIFRNEFETISGRFKQRRFDRSLDENYQILCQALEKKNGYRSQVNKFKKDNKDFLSCLKNSSIFVDNKQIDYLLDNGFPFNPISIYALIQTSEKVAQNERTLFTFISDNDINSFNYFIVNNDSDLLNVSVIYDYFESLIKNNNQYKTIAYKVDSLTKKTIVQEERNVIKTIAIMKLIDDNVKYSTSIFNIALSLNKPIDYVKRITDSLISQNLLKKNINDNSIDFAFIAENDINELIQNVVVKKFSGLRLSDLLNKFDKNRYYISNEYNFKNEMVRFYKSIYLESSIFMKISDFSNLFIGNECDGILINLINDDYVTSSELFEVITRSNCKNLIVRFADKSFSDSAINKIYNLFAAIYLLDNKKEISENMALILPSYISDTSNELENYIRGLYDNSKCFNYSSIKKNKKNAKLKDCINISLSDLFNKTVIFNNEQVNKNNISSVTAKARNEIIDNILCGVSKDYGKTSQEATIFDSFKESLSINDRVVELIKKWLISSNGEKKCSDELITLLKQPPYGMRNGIIPLFIGEAISRISTLNKTGFDTILLYNDIQEIELSAMNLSKVVSNPSKYYFCFESINKIKLNVTNKLLKIMKCEKKTNYSENIICLVQKIKNKVSNLAPIIIKTSTNENLLLLSEEEIEFKNTFLKHDLNNYELLFEILPKVLDCEFESLPVRIIDVFESYNHKLENLYLSVIQVTKEKLIPSDTIKTSFELWYSNNKQVNTIVFEENEKKLFRTLKTIEYNDFEAINILSYSVVGCTLDSWNDYKKESFFKTFDCFLETVKNYNTSSGIKKSDFDVNSSSQLSSLGKTLYSNLFDSLEEYGSSLSNEEKALILKRLLNDILN